MKTTKEDPSRKKSSMNELTVLSQIPHSPLDIESAEQHTRASSSSFDPARTSTNALTQSPGTLDGSTDMYFLKSEVMNKGNKVEF